MRDRGQEAGAHVLVLTVNDAPGVPRQCLVTSQIPSLCRKRGKRQG